MLSRPFFSNVTNLSTHTMKKQHPIPYPETRDGNLVIQDNREFLEYMPGSFCIYRINGKYYNGKKFGYHRCSVCGKLVCHMMGGAARHYNVHKLNP